MREAARSAILDDIARRIADYSVVPFVGSGCSKDHLTYDWDGLTGVLAAEIGERATLPNTLIAQRYEDSFGRERLVSRLRELLSIEDFDDAKGESILALGALGLKIFYTTNVDNVFEAYATKFRRPIAAVSRLDDLRRVKPDQLTLYQYHGALAHPETVVWTEQDYARRAAEGDDFFLNVRLKSDLLTKSFLFVGYSIRDPHVAQLLRDFAHRYANALRGSYLISVGDAVAMRERTAGLGVTVVSARELAPEAQDDSAALRDVLMSINRSVVGLHAKRDLEFLFRGRGEFAIASPRDIEVTLLSLPDLPIDDAIRALRALLNGKATPPDAEARIAASYEALAERVATQAQARELSFAQFGLRFAHYESALRIYAATIALQQMAAPNGRLAHVTTIPDTPAYRVCGIAAASTLLERWRRPLNTTFADWVVTCVQDLEAIDGMEPHLQAYAKQRFERIFAGSPRTNPLSRRLPDMYKNLKFSSYDEIMSNMLQAMPKGYLPPDERG